MLDESHNIKDPNSQANKACTALTSGRRWCVSGTPITKNIEDLMGQFKFLGLSPLDKPGPFAAVAADSRKLLALLRRILIRHSKTQKVLRAPKPAPLEGGDEATSSSSSSSISKSSMSRLVAAGVVTSDGLVEEPLLELPPLTMVVEELPFSLEQGETAAYRRLEASAKNQYLALRRQGPSAVKSNTLVITERLLRPLRQACSGGIIDAPSKVTAASGAAKAKCGAVEAMAEDGDEDEASGESKVVMTSKLEALIANLRRVQGSDPTAKCLVFTSFKPTLDWLAETLPARGFSFRTLRGDMSQAQREEALLAFRDDPPTTVFLLSLRAGAVGINLTEANHIFLLEPLLNPGLEKQAIGRVHRM